MANAKQRRPRKSSYGVKIVVEITGHMQKTSVDRFMAKLSSVVSEHMENGGNGG